MTNESLLLEFSLHYSLITKEELLLWRFKQMSKTD